MALKTYLGIIIGILNLAGLICTLIALSAVIIIAKMPRSSSIYTMAATNLSIDVIQLMLGLFYLTPSIIFNSFLFPGGRQDPWVVFLGSTFLFCWYYGSVAQILVALNRLVVVCFPQYDIFTPRKVLIIMMCLYPVAFAVTILSQYILPCCNFSFDHQVLSYTYNQLPDVFNYSNAYIDLWLNSTSSASCLSIYAVFKKTETFSTVFGLTFYASCVYAFEFGCFDTAQQKIIGFVRRMNKMSQNALNEQQKHKRRMKEYRYALQFTVISLFYLFSWVFFRVFPLFITDSDSLNWFSVIAICVAVNSSANAIVYLMSNQEVYNVVKHRFILRNSVHMTSNHNGSTVGRGGADSKGSTIGRGAHQINTIA